MPRTACSCDHGFPVCACVEGTSGPALWLRSRQLSALAGWPARPTDEGLAFARSLLRPVPVALGEREPAADCGCGAKSEPAA